MLKCACICTVKPFWLVFLLFSMTASRVHQKTELHVFLCQIWLSLKICYVPIYGLMRHVGESLKRPWLRQNMEQIQFATYMLIKTAWFLHQGTVWMLGLMLRNYINVLLSFFLTFYLKLKNVCKNQHFIPVGWLTTHASKM